MVGASLAVSIILFHRCPGQASVRLSLAATAASRPIAVSVSAGRLPPKRTLHQQGYMADLLDGADSLVFGNNLLKLPFIQIQSFDRFARMGKF